MRCLVALSRISSRFFWVSSTGDDSLPSYTFLSDRALCSLPPLCFVFPSTLQFRCLGLHSFSKARIFFFSPRNGTPCFPKVFFFDAGSPSQFSCSRNLLALSLRALRFGVDFSLFMIIFFPLWQLSFFGVRCGLFTAGGPLIVYARGRQVIFFFFGEFPSFSPKRAFPGELDGEALVSAASY